ncbi:MAG: Meiotic Sister-Chromatid recombination aldehyde dehydrogenase [Trizodia sp. TS-e1964]|nr:MAG: Meiotic Sister-Chromatid recombination aldehyde dehydrogenase [Trizodia sp. TS-e1964]
MLWPDSWLGDISHIALPAILLGIVTLVIYFRRGEPTPSYNVEPPPEAALSWDGKVLETPSLKVAGSTAIQCYCPANGKLLGRILPASKSGIDRALVKATVAQLQWATTSFEQRRRVLRTMLKFVLDNQANIARVACLDTGKTEVDAALGEILVTVEKLRWTILHGEKALRTERRPTNLLMAYKVNEVRWEPLGVVAACVSWNYPFHNLIGPAISALFAGNSIVVKASEATAWSSDYFMSIVRGALGACGHSPDLAQLIVCWPSVAPHLTSHPSISHLTFIGSRPVALQVAASAARSLIPVCMELGGKDAAVILDDVQNLKDVISILLRGTFQNGGQNCIGIERIIVCAGKYDTVVNRLKSRVNLLQVGSAMDDPQGVDMGAMISAEGFGRLEALIDLAVMHGARCLVGGKRFHHPKYPNGHYFMPTLLVDVTPHMAIAQQELFAPVCVVMRAANVTDAVLIANSTVYGLGASVFGHNRAALETVVSGVKSGMVSVNDFGVYYAVQLPFGGVKASGYGRFGGKEGLRALCNTKAVCRDRFPRVATTAIPKSLDYPIVSAKQAWRMCVGIVEFGYGETLKMRVQGILKLVLNG